jgi:hypothetical protein
MALKCLSNCRFFVFLPEIEKLMLLFPKRVLHVANTGLNRIRLPLKTNKIQRFEKWVFFLVDSRDTLGDIRDLERRTGMVFDTSFLFFLFNEKEKILTISCFPEPDSDGLLSFELSLPSYFSFKRASRYCLCSSEYFYNFILFLHIY